VVDSSEGIRSRVRASFEGGRSIQAVARPPEGVGPAPAVDLRAWLDAHRIQIADRWREELNSRAGVMDRGTSELVGELLHLLTSLLVPGFGIFRVQAESVLQQAAELYGNLGAHRGLAAGDAVEELQILREVLLRLLHGEAGRGAVAPELRDLLQLNRLIDRAVTYASIGHTDTLFFVLVHGTGASGPPTPELLAAVKEQVRAIRGELTDILQMEQGPEA
jgi:hypothetical protein